MKLSEAIELTITSGTYNQCNEFMCIALGNKKLHQFIPDVEEMVNSIHPNTGGIPLSCALHAKHYINLNDGSWKHAQIFAYTQQLYCWWVFDLKRKGL